MIAIDDLDLVRGGAGGKQWNAYVAQQRKLATPALKKVSCAAAGAIGGDKAATQAFDHPSEADKIRGGQMLENICNASTNLPEGAKLPF